MSQAKVLTERELQRVLDYVSLAAAALGGYAGGGVCSGTLCGCAE